MYYGVSVRHVRLRFKGVGQQLAGYMWWINGGLFIHTPRWR